MTARTGVRSLWAIALGAPLAVLALQAVSIRWLYPQVIPHEFTVRAAGRTLGAAATRSAFADGALLSSAVTIAALFLAVPTSSGILRLRPRGRVLVAAALFLPSLLPPVGLAMGVGVALLNIGADGSFLGLVAAHLVVALPYAVAALTATRARHDTRLEAQAASLGASPTQTLFHVTIPALRSGVTVAATLAFVVSWSQYLLTVLAGSGSVITPTVLLVNAASGGNPAATATLALAVALPTAAVGIAASAADRATLFREPVG